MTEKFVAGIVGAPFGLKGFVKVKTFSGETGHLLKLKSILLRKDGLERTMEIAESSASGQALVIRFVGYSGPEQAGGLRGAELLVGREDAAPLRPGEFYVEDLKGMTVFGESGEILGKIISVIEGGGGDLAEVCLADGQKRMVPFRDEFFSGIDTENARAVLLNTWILE